MRSAGFRHAYPTYQPSLRAKSAAAPARREYHSFCLNGGQYEERSKPDRSRCLKIRNKNLMLHGLGSLVRLGLVIVGIGVAGMVAFAALVHVAEVIP